MGALDYAPLALPKRYPKLLHQEGTIAYSANTVSNPLRIDPSGLLLGLLLTFVGDQNASTSTPTASTEGIYGLVKRVQLSVGGGVGRLVDLTGYELNVIERTREQDYVDDAKTPTTNGTKNATFSLYVPVCVRDGDLYSEYTDLLGALYTGDPQVTCNLVITWGDQTNVYSTVAGATITNGTLTVTSHKLDVPTPDKDPELFAAISWNHVVIEEINDTTLTAAGNKILLLSTNEPRVYLRLWLLYGEGTTTPVWKNGILNTLDFSIQDYLHPVEQIVEAAQLEMQLRRYATALPAGTYVVDFASSMYRNQWLPVDRITLAKLVPNFNSPGANAIVRLCQESVVPSPLARKWAQQMAAGKRAA